MVAQKAEQPPANAGFIASATKSVAVELKNRGGVFGKRKQVGFKKYKSLRHELFT